jgi:hypothetical protein
MGLEAGLSQFELDREPGSSHIPTMGLVARPRDIIACLVKDRKEWFFKAAP